MSPLRCTLFGHRAAGRWPDHPGYATRIVTGPVDNIGRIHGELRLICRRCGVEFAAAKLHLNDPQIIAALGNPPAIDAGTRAVRYGCEQ